MSQHSPLPWKVLYDQYGKAVDLLDADGEPVEDTAENAAYVVTACNMHERLVESLSVILERACGNRDATYYDFAKARALLAEAKGETT